MRHFVTTASTAAFRVVPAMAVYAGTKVAVRAIAFAVEQPGDVDVDEIVVRPTAQA